MYSLVLAGCVVLALVMAGCELQTEDPELPILNPADNLVINEVFTLPLDHPVTYTWLELYNPTPDTINLTNWRISYETFRVRNEYTVVLDSLFNFVEFVTQISVVDSVGRFDVPIGEGLFVVPGEDPDLVLLPPGGLFTLVNIEDRLLDHVQWGPGDERFRRERQQFQDSLLSFVIIPDTTQDTLITVMATVNSYGFFFEPSSQLILKDPSGTAVDVVRFGDYVYSGSEPDQWPENVSFGAIPEFQSIQRYAGGYSTGNTASDFYASSPDLVPTPHFYNLVHKK
jgi:hypothetical protein